MKRISTEEFMRYRNNVKPISSKVEVIPVGQTMEEEHITERFVGNNGKNYNMHIITHRGNETTWMKERHEYFYELIRD